ncbi:hypothetical protein IC615_16980 [Serratia ureilytica]
MKRLVHLHHYRALLRSLLIAVFIGVAAALAVWLFHRSMIGLGGCCSAMPTAAW